MSIGCHGSEAVTVGGKPERHEMALDPGPADLGFVSKGSRESMKIDEIESVEGALSARPCGKWLFFPETLAIGSFSEIVASEASVCPFYLQRSSKDQGIMPTINGISLSHLPLLWLTGIPTCLRHCLCLPKSRLCCWCAHEGSGGTGWDLESWAGHLHRSRPSLE